MRAIKIVIVGDSKVGKTSISNKFVSNNFSNITNPTIGAAFLTKIITINSGSVRLQLWDTAGQEKYRSLAPMYYRSAHISILVYDVTSRVSFESIPFWSTDIMQKTPNMKIVLVGNKVDLENKVISTEEGKELSEKIGSLLFFEASAKTGESIESLFFKVAELTEDNLDIVEKPPEIINQPIKKTSCC